MSSAKSKSFSCLPLTQSIPLSVFVWRISQSIAKPNNSGDITQPCLTPLSTRNHSLYLSSTFTEHSLSRYRLYSATKSVCVCVVQLVSEFCRLDLTCPVPGCGPYEVRTLLLEGMLRLRDSTTAKVRKCTELPVYRVSSTSQPVPL